ncbi:hypothetical protein KDA_76880 [Dictyobacter alpinus]|uniref:Conjugal transfer protein TraG n=1 Tax=Dictyobacter alpinus TaxID=2014873 RepID=A0A402BLI1_9CHLR|nr:type IV secretory system conjugative DNA transfer family protein [Dictyobacter alpinus]GCE32204.1 hypothetical protein KDA_76880 [Dictyobacter alpinus]
MTRKPGATAGVLLFLLLLLLTGIIAWWIPTAQHFYASLKGETHKTTVAVTPTTEDHQRQDTKPALPPPGKVTARPTLEQAQPGGINPQYALFGLAGVCILMWGVLTVTTGRRRFLRASTRHGSAHQATSQEAKLYQHPTGRKLARAGDTATPPESRLVLGRYKGKELSLSEKQQESNILLTAPVGSGKSSGIIIPNLLRERGSRSLFIPDVKGELLKVTGATVAEHHEVWVFAPMNPAQSHHYNPLAFCQSIEDAQDLAQSWISNTGESKDDFWPNVARRLLTFVILHLREAEPEAPFSRVSDCLCRMSYEELKAALIGSPSAVVKAEAASFFDYIDQNERLVGSLMTDLATRFQLMLSPQIREATAHSEIDFARMTQDPIALYLSLPTRGVERCRPLLAVFVTQMFATFQRRAEAAPDGRLPRRVACYMDEFANLGHIPNINSYISTMRSSGVSMLIAIQSFNQLDDRYGQSTRKNILANTVTHLLLPGAGLDETQYYSSKIGKSTIVTESYSDTRQLGSFSLFASRQGSLGESQGESQRELMTADELRTMAPGSLLILGSNSAPILATSLPYYQDSSLVRLSRRPAYIFPPREEPEKPEPEKERTEGKKQDPTQAEPQGKAKEEREDESPKEQLEEETFSPAPEE